MSGPFDFRFPSSASATSLSEAPVRLLSQNRLLETGEVEVGIQASSVEAIVAAPMAMMNTGCYYEVCPGFPINNIVVVTPQGSSCWQPIPRWIYS